MTAEQSIWAKNTLQKKKYSLGKAGTIIALSLVVVTLGVLTYQYFKYQLDKAMDYCYKLTKLKINEFAFKKAVITVYLKILNKSDIDIKIKSQSYIIKVNGYPVSTMKSLEQVIIKAKDTFELPIKITFNPMEVLKIGLLNIDVLATAKENMKIAIEGTFRGGSGFIIVSYPIKLEYTLGELLADTGTESCWDRK